MAANFGSPPLNVNNQVVLVCSPQQRSRRYVAENTSAAKGLSITQFVLGIACFVSQIITTALYDYVEAERKDKVDNLYFNSLITVDQGGTGIWVGLAVITAASIGIVGATKNKSGLIITHLIFNVLLLPFSISLITASGISVSMLRRCRDDGENYGYYGHMFWESNLISREFLGEQINLGGIFRCEHSLFKAWLTFSCIQVIASSLLLVISFTLLIYNSMAVCHSCCSCCYDDYNGAVISYTYPRNVVYPLTTTYITNNTQLNMMPQAPTTSAPAPYIPMPPPYVPHDPEFNPPPKYELFDSYM